MNNQPASRTRAIIWLLAVVVLAACYYFFVAAYPPDELVRKSVADNARTQATLTTLFLAGSEVQSHRIVKKYAQGDGVIYEFAATVKLTMISFGRQPDEKIITITGKQYFEKQGGQWYSRAVF